VDEPTEEISPFDVGHTAGRFNGSETLGYLKGQSPMRASPVVVAHIDPKDAIEMPGAPISSQSRHSARSVSTQRSAKAFALGALIGVRITRIPSDTKVEERPHRPMVPRGPERESEFPTPTGWPLRVTEHGPGLVQDDHPPCRTPRVGVVLLRQAHVAARIALRSASGSTWRTS
jgi:hypothetical protein